MQGQGHGVTALPLLLRGLRLSTVYSQTSLRLECLCSVIRCRLLISPTEMEAVRGIHELESVWSEILRLGDQYLLANAREIMGRITLLQLSSGGTSKITSRDSVALQLLMLAE